MPLQATSGAASYDAFGGGVPVVPKYIEEYFSCFLYTGNGTSQTINNGIDIAGKGGLVWTKSRTTTAWHEQTDTARGASVYLSSNATNAQNSSQPNHVTAFNSNGFSVGNETDVNASGVPYVSWTWAKAPKFFDVVTWSGNSVSGRQISHALGSTPGCIIVKCTSTSGDDWCVFHRSLGRSSAIFLNLTSASGSSALWDGTDPTSTNFTVSSNGSVNGTGNTYVAYLFAHNAGGFGLTGTDNVITCGSYTGNSSSTGPVVTLGYEPQWLMIKDASATNDWFIIDNMRGLLSETAGAAILYPNLSSAEFVSGANIVTPTATGFKITTTSDAFNFSGRTYIYIAIRRGPMKVPTSGTSVFAPNAYSGTGTDTTITSTGFAPDLFFSKARSFSSAFLNVMVIIDELNYVRVIDRFQ